MFDLNGDLSEVIDDMVNEQTGARFVGGLRNVGSSFKNQLKVMTAAIGNLYGAEADEVFGLLRLFALGKVLNITAIEALADEFIEEFPVKTINVAAAAVTTTDADAEKYVIDLPQAEDEIMRMTEETLEGLGLDEPDLTDSPLYTNLPDRFRLSRLGRFLSEAFKPSELKDESPKLYRLVQMFMEQNTTDVNKEMSGYVTRLIDEVRGRVEAVEEYVELARRYRSSPAGTTGGRIGSTRAPGPTPPRTLPENLQEQELVQTVIDFNELRSKNMNEMFLQQFGAMVELVLDSVFSGTSLPMAIKGSQGDVAAFAKAIGGEKKFIDSARKYGLNHPTTYKNKAKLNNAIKKFEKETGVKWPFR